MTRLVITLNAGQDDLYAVSRLSHERYAKRIGATHVTLTGRAGWGHVTHEKWRYRKWVAAADRTIVLDTDTWVHPDCPDLFDIVPDTHIGVSRVDPWLGDSFGWKRELVALCASQGIPVPPGADGVYWNVGVWVGSRAHADFWEAPPFPERLSGRWCDEEQWGKCQVFRRGWEVVDYGKRFNYQWYLDKGFERLGVVRPWIVHLAGMGQLKEGHWRVPLIRLLESQCGTGQ